MKTVILRYSAIAFFSLCLLFPLVGRSADTYYMGIAPALSYEETLKIYQPMLAYLSQKAGVKIELRRSGNFLGYWSQMKKPGNFDFVFDGAHLAAYRVVKMQHRLLARVTGVLSFTLISRPDDLILDPEELVNRKVATPPSPYYGGLQVYNLFSEPARQPRIVEVRNAIEALEAVRSGKADAAFVPTPLLTRYPEAAVITSSKPTPNLTMTASPQVPAKVADAVARALLEAEQSKEGRAMLKAVNITRFEPAKRADYEGLETVLQDMWGY